jgi:hypothetical protein
VCAQLPVCASARSRRAGPETARGRRQPGAGGSPGPKAGQARPGLEGGRSYGWRSVLLEPLRSCPMWIEAERIGGFTDRAASVLPWGAVAIV